MSWGRENRGGINQRGGAYFLVNVEKDQSEKGFFIQCTASSKVNLKIMLFNANGDVLCEADSSISQPNAEAAMYFTNFETGSPAVRPPAGGTISRLAAHSGIAYAESTDPVVGMCDSLDCFEVKKQIIAPGPYLVGVQCATQFSRTSFAVYAVRASEDEKLVRTVLLACRK